MIKGFYCEKKKRDLSFGECLACAASGKNRCQFDYPILFAMQKNIRKRKGVSASSLLNCLRKVALQRRRNVYLNPKQLYYAFRGQLFHEVIAKAQPFGAICERRFERKIAGINLSGHPDAVYPKRRRLVDYKSTRRVPKEDVPYASHGTQVNLYRYLVLPEYGIDNLEIVYFDMRDVKRVKVEVMQEEELVAWLVPRIERLKGALEGGKLPRKAKGEELWQCRGYCPFTKICWPKGVPGAKGKRKKRKNERRPLCRKFQEGGQGKNGKRYQNCNPGPFLPKKGG